MHDVLKSIEEDLVLLNTQIQGQMRTVAGDANCSSCLFPIVNSINSNLYRILSKIRSHLMSHSLYALIKERINFAQRSFLDKKIEKEEYLFQRSRLNFYLSEIDLKFREMSKTEVPNSLVISVLRKQLATVEESISLRPSDLLNKERDLLLSLLPSFASEEDVDQMVMSCIEANPSFKYKDIRAYVIDRLFCKEEDLANAIKNRLGNKTSPVAKA